MRKVYKMMSVFLATIILTCSIAGAVPLKAQASMPGVMDLESGVEMTMLLYSILESAMIAAGAKEGLDEYESGVSLLEAFDSFVSSMSPPSLYEAMEGVSYTFSDGTVKRYESDGEYYDFTDGTTIYTNGEFSAGLLPIYYEIDVDGTVVEIDCYEAAERVAAYNTMSGTITLDPDDTTTDTGDEWDETDVWTDEVDAYMKAKWAAIQEAKNGGSSGEDPGGDGGNNKNPFSKIQTVIIGTGLVALVGNFVKALLNDEVEGLDKETYLFPVFEGRQEYYWDGSYDMMPTGNYLVKGSSYWTDQFGATYEGSYNTFTDVPLAIYLTAGSSYFYHYDSSSDKLIETSVISAYSKTQYGKTEYYSDRTYLYRGKLGGTNYMNIPIFTNMDELKFFLVSGDTAGILNAAPYDYSALADSVPETLKPLTGVNFSPNELPGINAALSSAATEVQPDTTTDAATNTDTYKQTITEAMQEAAPEAQPMPDVGTGDASVPNTPTDTEIASGEHSGDIIDLLNGLLLLIYIIILLLRLFIHCLTFIINIFRIPATTGYLPDDMVLGLNFLKTLEITGIGLSVYDFMMGLVYILLVFGVIKVLRTNINHIRIPKMLNGK